TGQVIGERETMTAAHALSLGATLVKNNTRHFARISPPLLLENWVIPDDYPNPTATTHSATHRGNSRSRFNQA
ncbi:MAG: hypothetical protein ACR2OU_02835, partial [Thermomicrobiales bacterium]